MEEGHGEDLSCSFSWGQIQGVSSYTHSPNIYPGFSCIRGDDYEQTDMLLELTSGAKVAKNPSAKARDVGDLGSISESED